MTSPSDKADELRLAYVSVYVKQLDPSASDASITRYLDEIKTMATALQSLDLSHEPHLTPFTAEWPTSASA